MATNTPNNDPIALKMMQLMFKVLSPLFPNTMGKFAYHLWFTPPRPHPPEAEKVAATKAQASFITVDGLRIRIWSWGQGPTILFIHGWGGRGTQISSFIDILNQSGYKVMSFDLPAHGQSDGKITDAFSVSKTLNEVIKKIDNLHTVITHSFGGIIFGHFYTPSLNIKKIVMFCPPSTVTTPFKEFSDKLKLPETIKNYVLKKIEDDLGSDAFERLSLLKNAEKIVQPVLVVHDKSDDVVPFEEGKNVASIIQHGTFLGSYDLGHRKILFDQTLIQQVVNFIKN